MAQIMVSSEHGSPGARKAVRQCNPHCTDAHFWRWDWEFDIQLSNIANRLLAIYLTKVAT